MHFWTRAVVACGSLGPATGLAPAALALSAGVGAFYLLPRMPPQWSAWVLGSAALALFAVRIGRCSRLAGVFLLGVLWAMLDAGALLWHPFPDSLTREPLIVEGRIASIPEDKGYAYRFLFRVDSARSRHGPVAFRGLVRLNWYDARPRLVAGARWRLPVRLKAAHGYANPGGFDYERWLFERGILATGNVRSGDEARLLDPGPGSYPLTRIRQRIAEDLTETLAGSRVLGLVLALTIGDRSALERADWDLLTRTGTNHLVAISGLHVGMVAALVFFIVRRGWGMLPGLALRLSAPQAGALAAGVAALGYAALAGFSVSTQRALIMLAVVLGAMYFRRTLRPWHAISLALAGVLIVDPRAVLAFGFWLSFGAVVALLLHLGQRLSVRAGSAGRVSGWGRAQWAVALGLLPLLLGLFGRASLVAPGVNLVAVPLFGLVLLPLLLLGAAMSVLFGIDALLLAAAWLLELFLAALAWVAGLSWAAIGIAERPLWAWLAAGFGVLLLLAPRGLPGRWVALALLLPLPALRAPVPQPGEAWVTLLDVGQGLSAVVRTAAGTLVYDTGPGFESGFNTGSLVLVPFLAAQGVDRVDALVLSHADRDHSGGTHGLMERVAVDRILSGEARDLDVEGVRPCRAGERWTWSGIDFRFLHPAGEGESGNDASCVLRVASAGGSILLTGDIGARVERALVGTWDGALASDVLLAGHHGSATSMSPEILDAVAPRLVLYATGFANPFGFPAQAVTDRVTALGIPAMDTGTQGAIELRLRPDGIAGPWSWRERAARMWTHLPEPPGTRPGSGVFAKESAGAGVRSPEKRSY